MLHVAFNVPRFSGKSNSLELLERLHTLGEVVGDVLKLAFGDKAIATLIFITSLFSMIKFQLSCPNTLDQL